MFGTNNNPTPIKLDVVNQKHTDSPFIIEIKGFGVDANNNLFVKGEFGNTSSKPIDSFQAGVLMRDKFKIELDFLVIRHTGVCMPKKVIQWSYIFPSTPVWSKHVGYLTSFPMKVRFLDGEIVDFYNPRSDGNVNV